jgi:hypothetical protein
MVARPARQATGNLAVSGRGATKQRAEIRNNGNRRTEGSDQSTVNSNQEHGKEIGCHEALRSKHEPKKPQTPMPAKSRSHDPARAQEGTAKYRRKKKWVMVIQFTAHFIVEKEWWVGRDLNPGQTA